MVRKLLCAKKNKKNYIVACMSVIILIIRVMEKRNQTCVSVRLHSSAHIGKLEKVISMFGFDSE